MWIGTCITAATCLVFLLWYFRWGDDHLSADKRRVLAFVIALTAGAFGNFLAGDVTLNISGELHAGWKFGIQATGAIALFVLTLVLFRDVLVQQPPIDPAPSGEAKDLLDGHLSNQAKSLKTAHITIGRQTQEIEELTKQRDEALDMARQGKAAGDPLATEAVAEYERDGDMAGLQRLLIERKKKPKADLLNLNRKLAAVAYLRGDIDEAMATVKEILALDPDDLHGRNQLGQIHLLRGNLKEAERAYKRVLRVAKRHKDKGWQAAAYGNLGLIHQTRGKLDEALRMFNKALEMDEQSGDHDGMAADYGNLGNVYLIRGELDKAERKLNKALELYKQIENREGMANQYGNLGLIYRMRGELDKAERMHRKSLEINKKLGRMEGVASAYGNLGLIYQTRGELDEAERMHRKSLKINKKLGRMEGVASVYGNLGLIYRTRGELDEAGQMHRKSLEINEKLGRMEGMANNYANLGAVAERRGDTDEARRLWTQSRDLYAEIGMPHMVERVQGWLDK